MISDQELSELKGKLGNLVTYSDNEDESSSIVNEVFQDDMNYDIHRVTMNAKIDNLCRAVTFDKSFAIEKKQNTKFDCKVCQCEGRRNAHRNSVFCSNHGVVLCQRVNVHPKDEKLFKIGTSKVKYVNKDDINNWEWSSPIQVKWTCWETAHDHYIPNGLFKLKDEKSVNVRYIDNYSSFNILSRPFILQKKAFIETFYKCCVVTKSNNIFKRTGTRK